AYILEYITEIEDDETKEKIKNMPESRAQNTDLHKTTEAQKISKT
ncbi:26418_t:CDS:1, partial [Racocetra persica]